MRVIAGQARGRPLLAPAGDTRPTSDKIKGAIFSMLEAEALRRIEPAREEDEGPDFAATRAWPIWLDLYAGSGALGVEALSRGAERVDFVERSAAARDTIRKNLERTGLAERGRIRSTPVERLLSAAPEQRYDVVLLDPPYAEVAPDTALARLEEAGLVRPGGVVVLEHARTREAPRQVGNMRLLRTRSHGRTSISLYETSAEA